MCSVMPRISCSRPVAEQWLYVQREYVTLPQINSFVASIFVSVLCKTVVYLGDCTSAVLGDFASSIRVAKQWKVSLKAPWQGKVTWNQIHGCRLLLYTSHVALMTLDIFWNFFVFVSNYWQLRHVHNLLLVISNVIRPHQYQMMSYYGTFSFYFLLCCKLHGAPLSKMVCSYCTLSPWNMYDALMQIYFGKSVPL